MSSRSSRALAAQRQEGDGPKTTAAGTIPDSNDGTSKVKAGDALVAIIPSETISFYTPITTIVVSQLLKNSSAPDRYMGLRWSLWVAGILISIALVAKDRISPASGAAKWPTAEMFSAGLAFAAWGLSTPESPLLAEVKDSLDSVVTLIISSGTLLFLTFFSSTILTKKAK